MGATAYGFLILAALLEVGGDYLIRIGLPSALGRMISGAVLLVLYGFAVNLFWRGEFSRLLGLYIAVFLVVSQGWGWAMEGERMTAPKLFGAVLVVAGGLVIQFWRTAK